MIEWRVAAWACVVMIMPTAMPCSRLRWSADYAEIGCGTRCTSILSARFIASAMS